MTSLSRRAFLAAAAGAAGGVVGVSNTAPVGTMVSEIPTQDYGSGDTPSNSDYDWNQLRQGRIFIYYPDGYKRDGRALARDFGVAKKGVREYFDLDTGHDVEVYVYPGEKYPVDGNDETFARTTTIPVPVTHNIVLSKMVFPTREAWAADYSARVVDELFLFSTVHEFVHVASLRLMYASGFPLVSVPELRMGVLPEWFTEGVCQYITQETMVKETESWFNPFSDRLNDVGEKLRSGDGDPPGLEYVRSKPYSAGHLMVTWMVEYEWSWSEVKQVFSTPRGGFDAVLQDSLGVGERELERRWLRWVNDETRAEWEIPVGGRSSPVRGSRVRR